MPKDPLTNLLEEDDDLRRLAGEHAIVTDALEIAKSLQTLIDSSKSVCHIADWKLKRIRSSLRSNANYARHLHEENQTLREEIEDLKLRLEQEQGKA